MIDIVKTWPELFESLTDKQVFDVRNTIASAQLEGYKPTREDIIRSIEVRTGRKSADQVVAEVLAQIKDKTPLVS